MGLSLAERLDRRRSILLIVDMQNDYCHPNGTAGGRGRDLGFTQQMMPRLLRLIGAAREHGFPICFIRTLANDWTNSEVWTEFKDKTHLGVAEGSWGAEFCAGFEPRNGELVITKHRYSAFVGTNLDQILRSRGVDNLIMTGVGTGMCVFQTLSVGFMLDYYITLVEDCAATSYGPQSHNEAVAHIRKHFGVIANSSEIIDIWSQSRRKAG
jgi:ureidoacrylate peracid hydrolase